MRRCDAQAAQAANAALQNEIMLLQARLSEQNEVLRRSSPQENMSGPGPADRSQDNKQSADNHITGEQSILKHNTMSSALRAVHCTLVFHATGLR
jgi:hypothetical protein